MKKQYIVILMATLMVFSALAVLSILFTPIWGCGGGGGGGCPPCGSCQTCQGGVCVYYGTPCGSSCCSVGRVCCGGHCRTGAFCCGSGACSAGSICCNNQCYSGGKCCKDVNPNYHCADTQICCHGACCSGECCVTAVPGSGSSAVVLKFHCCDSSQTCCEEGCCNSGLYCCNKKCSECSGSLECIEKYNFCYICDDSVTPCKCKVRPDYFELHYWYEWEECPILRQHPDRDKKTDGCSPFFTPDDPTKYLFNLLCQNTTFRGVCERHDFCYQTCQSDMFACDGGFCNGMDGVCESLTGANRLLCYPACKSYSTLYCSVVRMVGAIPWMNDQVLYCVCCGTE